MHTVLQKKGNSALIKSDVDGTIYRRNITHLKKYESDFSQTDPWSRTQDRQDDDQSNQYVQNKLSDDSVQTQCTENKTAVESNCRPTRKRKMPEKFKDYEMT